MMGFYIIKGSLIPMHKYANSPLHGRTLLHAQRHSQWKETYSNENDFLELSPKTEAIWTWLSDTSINLIFFWLLIFPCLACSDSRLDLKIHCSKVLHDKVYLWEDYHYWRIWNFTFECRIVGPKLYLSKLTTTQIECTRSL